jgi:hypothetical protein
MAHRKNSPQEILNSTVRTAEKKFLLDEEPPSLLLVDPLIPLYESLVPFMTGTLNHCYEKFSISAETFRKEKNPEKQPLANQYGDYMALLADIFYYPLRHVSFNAMPKISDAINTKSIPLVIQNLPGIICRCQQLQMRDGLEVALIQGNAGLTSKLEHAAQNGHAEYTPKIDCGVYFLNGIIRDKIEKHRYSKA